MLFHYPWIFSCLTMHLAKIPLCLDWLVKQFNLTRTGNAWTHLLIFIHFYYPSMGNLKMKYRLYCLLASASEVYLWINSLSQLIAEILSLHFCYHAAHHPLFCNNFFFLENKLIYIALWNWYYIFHFIYYTILYHTSHLSSFRSTLLYWNLRSHFKIHLINLKNFLMLNKYPSLHQDCMIFQVFLIWALKFH